MISLTPATSVEKPGHDLGPGRDGGSQLLLSGRAHPCGQGPVRVEAVERFGDRYGP